MGRHRREFHGLISNLVSVSNILPEGIEAEPKLVYVCTRSIRAQQTQTDTSGEGNEGYPVAKPTLELEALTMTDSELATAQLNMKAAIVAVAQQIKRLPPDGPIDRLTSALRLKLTCLETLHKEHRSRRSFSGSKG